MTALRRRLGGPVSASAPARICLTNEFRDFAGFWPRSDRLGAARFYAFQCADILELLCESFVAARKLEPVFIAILGKDDEPLAAFPLCIEHRRNYTRISKDVRILKFLDGDFGAYNAPVVFPPVADWDMKTVRTIWTGIRRLVPPFDIAVFDNMPDRVGDLPNPLRLLGASACAESGHAATLSGKWQDLERKLGDRELRRQKRRLGELGRLTFDLAETPEQYDLFLEALVRQKRQRFPEWRGRLDSPGFCAYLSGARRMLYPAGPVCLFGLKINDTIIATIFGYAVGPRFDGQICTFEAGLWQKYSPSRLLFNKVFEWCVAKGLEFFDFGIGDQQYKDGYCDVTMALNEATIPGSAKGRIIVSWRNMILDNQRRVRSLREMELAETCSSGGFEPSAALGHAFRGVALWPSPRRMHKFLSVMKSVAWRELWGTCLNAGPKR